MDRSTGLWHVVDNPDVLADTDTDAEFVRLLNDAPWNRS
jgi:hypothetical protein